MRGREHGRFSSMLSQRCRKRRRTILRFFPDLPTRPGAAEGNDAPTEQVMRCWRRRLGGLGPLKRTNRFQGKASHQCGASPDQPPSTAAVVAMDANLLGGGRLCTLGTQYANRSGASKNKLPMVGQVLFAASGEREDGNVGQSAEHSILGGKTRRHKDIPLARQGN